MNIASALKQTDGPSLVQQAMDAVRSHIKDHQLKVGDTLPGEGDFGEALGVSRAVMREAFGALAALKLIDVANGRRARVGAIDSSVIATSLDHALATAQVSIPDIWDVRRTLEIRTAALAAARRTDAQAAEIIRCAEGMAAAGDNQAMRTENDIGFHAAIAEASGNALISQIVKAFAPLMQVAVPAAWQTRTTEAEQRDMLVLHLDLAHAIAAGDAAAASAAMDRHFDASVGDILQSSFS